MIRSICPAIFFRWFLSPPDTSTVSQPPLCFISLTAFITTGQLLSPSSNSTLNPSRNSLEFMFSRLNFLICSRMMRDRNHRQYIRYQRQSFFVPKQPNCKKGLSTKKLATLFDWNINNLDFEQDSDLKQFHCRELVNNYLSINYNPREILFVLVLQELL